MGCYEEKKSPVVCCGIIFAFVLSCPVIPSAVAQPSNTPSGSEFHYTRLSPPLAVIIVVLMAALFFMAFFTIYIRHCHRSSGGSIRQTLSMRRRVATACGLEASVIETFPTFTYAEVKDQHIGKGALECAVCLNEFEEDETLRLIPKCDHVFHPECIDAWLQSHVTCPVCRANLTPQPDEPPVLSRDSQEQTGTQQQNDGVSIRIVDDNQGQQPQQQEEGCVRPGVKRNLSFNLHNQPPRSFSIRRPRIFSKFRSHSTGHSLVLPGENLDRYTLRLPEEVRKEVFSRALLNQSKSCAVTLPREASSRRGYRSGNREGSSRGSRSIRRIERSEPGSRSDRWVFTIAPPFFSRGSSMKNPKVGGETCEGSTSRGETAVKMPSFKCLEPKRDEVSLVSTDSARPPV